MTAVNSVNRLECAIRIHFVAAGIQKRDELRGFLCESKAKQAVDRKGGIADPSVAVVPITRPAEAFGQAAGWRGDDGAGRCKGEQLQYQRRAVDRFAPAPAIGAFGNPLAPVAHGVVKKLLAHLFGTADWFALVRIQFAELEALALSFVQREFRANPNSKLRQWNRGGEAKS